MTNADEAWRVALCEPQRERLAAGHLLRIGIPSYLPVVVKTSSTGRGRQRRVERAMFPSYLFVRFSLEMPGWGRLFATPGIRQRHGLLMAGDNFAIISEAKIEAISVKEQQLAGEKNTLVKRMNLNVGERVRVQLNAYTDILAEIESLDDNERIGILFRLLGREVHSSVNVAQLAS